MALGRKLNGNWITVCEKKGKSTFDPGLCFAEELTKRTDPFPETKRMVLIAPATFTSPAQGGEAGSLHGIGLPPGHQCSHLAAMARKAPGASFKGAHIH